MDDGPAPDRGGAVPEHAVTVHHALEGDGSGTAREREAVRRVGRALRPAHVVLRRGGPDDPAAPERRRDPARRVTTGDAE